MKYVVLAFLALLLPLAGLAALPGDAAEGRRLHEAHCAGCHDSGVYTRGDRRVRSLDALRRQIDACGHMAKQDFSPAQTRDLLKYVNERYYRFP
jgi:mono/diheme cytochrome c family protein